MTPTEWDQELVLSTLRRIGGGVAVSELIYKTRLPETVVVEALCDLEALGLVTPWAWTAIDEGAV